MATRIITVCNQKGGSGKTTVAMQLAGALCRFNFTVLVADADRQATATRWAASAPDEAPFPATVVGLAEAEGKLHRELRKFDGLYDFIIVDCPPAVESPVPQSALLVSRLAIVPVIPSPADLWATLGIRALIDRARDFNDGLQARVLLNQYDPHRTLAKEALDLLPEFNFATCSSHLGHREIYRQCLGAGCTVYDFASRGTRAASEISSLASEVLSLLSITATSHLKEAVNA